MVKNYNAIGMLQATIQLVLLFAQAAGFMLNGADLARFLCSATEKDILDRI